MKLEHVLFGNFLSCSILFAYSGYHLPYLVGEEHYVSQGYDGTTSHHGAGGAYAVDFSGNFSVYSVKSGIVEKTGKDTYKIDYCKRNPQYWHGPAKYVVIKHPDGVYSYYYHLDSINVKKGDKVINGKTLIGVSGNTGCSTGNHLHLQFSSKPNMRRVNSLKIPFEDISGSGFPIEGYSYKSKNYPNTTNSNNANGSIFDGAGSLISYSDECWGCNKDEARMHKHYVGSTVVFQWKYNSEKCSHIDIHANKDVGEVIIKNKSWSGHLTEQAYKYSNLPVGKFYEKDGISVESSGYDDTYSWNTTSVTTTKPITSETSIYAYCRNNSDSFNYYNRKKIDKSLIDVTNGYYWTGTGSLITQATSRSGFGVTKDWAVAFDTKKSLTSFQWYSSNSCNKVVINKTDIQGYDNYSSVAANVSIKKWDQDMKGWSNVCQGLPCEISKPEEGYYIIKIKTAPGAIGSSNVIETKCVQ